MATSGQRRNRAKPGAVAKAPSTRTGVQRRPLAPKLTPPRPVRLYPRTRLFDLLDHLRQDHRVIWVSAPGGAGKTSLAASYLSARKLPILWYQVDAGDGDVASFFYYMGLAVQRAAPRHKKSLPVLTPEFLGDVPTFSRNFFRELYRRLPRNSTLVLDNYQDAPEDSLLHDVLHTAMSEIPDGMNLLVLSRIEPPAVLARLRLCDHAACLDWDRLQLTHEETAGLARLRSGRGLPDPKVIETLHARAHGWAAGVVLMLEQGRGGDILNTAKLPSGQKLLFDYFAGEILNRSDPLVREFLLKTALFPKVSADAARAISGIEKSREILDDLTRRNYFTLRHTGPGGDTYQYHPLFREFLLKTAEGNYSPEGLARLRTQAGETLIESGQINEGVELLIAAQAWPLLAEQIQRQAQTQLANGRWQTLSQWLAALPPPDVEANPWLLFWRANATMPRDLFAARADFHRAYLLFKDQADPAGSYLAWSGAVDTFMYVWVDFAPLDYWIDEMEVLRREFPEYPSLDIEARVTCSMVGAAIWRRADRPMMREWADAGISLLDKPIDPSIKLMTGYLLLLYLLWWQNNLRKSQVVFAKMHALGEDPHAGILARLMWKVMEATFLYMHGKADEAIRAAHDGLVLAAEVGVHHLDLLLYAQSAYGYLTKFDMDGASLDMRGMESLLQSTHTFDFAHYHYLMTWILLGQDDPLMTLEHMLKGDEAVNRAGASNYPAFNAVTQAQALYECGRTMEAIAAVETAREWGKRLGSPFIEIHSQFLYALRGLDQHDPDECAAALTIALRLCKDNGYFVVPWFGWRKPLLTRLLHQALVFDIELDYVRSVIKQRDLTPPTDVPIPDAWPFPLKLRTLGHFSVLVDDKPLKFSGKSQKKPLELLRALVAFGGREVSEAKLAEALWPDAEGDVASQSLATTLHRLRKLIGENTIERQEGRLSLDAGTVWVDAWAFERNLAELEQACQKSETDKLQALTTRLFTLYRGPFLKDEPDAPWLLHLRERLRAKFLRHLEAAARCFGEAKRHDQAIACYEKAIEIEPLAEGLYRGLMQAHLARGHRAEALAVYGRCRRILTTQLGITPSLDTEALARLAQP